MSVNYQEIEDLIQALITPQSARANQAKEMLVSYGSTAVPRLCEVLPSASEQGKWLIINILARIKDQRAMPVIATYLYSENQAIQALVAQYLGDSGHPAAVPLLLNALEALAQTGAAIWIVNALGKLRDGSAVKPLMNAIHSTNSPVIRYSAISALGQIGDPQAAKLIKSFTNDANHHVREHAQQALSLLNHEERV